MNNNYVLLPTRLEVLEVIIPLEFELMKNAKSEQQLRFLVDAQKKHFHEYKQITGKTFKHN